MAIFSGINANTPKHLLLDAGAFIRNYDSTKTYEQQVANVIGATTGGGSFSAVPTIRQVEVDGARGAIKELERIDEWVVTMTANVKELTTANIKTALGTGRTHTVGSGDPETALVGYTKLTADAEIGDSDYTGNIAWVGRLSGSDDPAIIVIKNGLATNGLTVTVSDKNEAVVAITITGHFGLTTLDEVPFAVYLPPVT